MNTHLEVDEEGRLVYVYTDSIGDRSYYEIEGFKFDNSFRLKFLRREGKT